MILGMYVDYIPINCLLSEQPHNKIFNYLFYFFNSRI